MKTQIKKAKKFDTVKIFREIKENISEEISGMNFEQFTAYINDNKSGTFKSSTPPKPSS